MPYEITTIARMGVNCYIIHSENSFIMVDSGFSWSRKAVNEALMDAGCRPGELKLVVVTHGDTDHTGNCVFLREQYDAKIAVHQSEAKTLETGDMLINRKSKRGFLLRSGFALSRIFMKGKFKPDIFLADGQELSPYGLNAKVIHTPGHSIGSLSVLTAEGDLFCGDFLVGGKIPRVNTLLDDPEEMAASLAKLNTLTIRKIYPGHGQAFTLEEFLKYNG
jgi:hydroxyacylglutathione hydrolase